MDETRDCHVKRNKLEPGRHSTESGKCYTFSFIYEIREKGRRERGREKREEKDHESKIESFIEGRGNRKERGERREGKGDVVGGDDQSTLYACINTPGQIPSFCTQHAVMRNFS